MASTISHNQSVNLTKTVIDKTPLPTAGQVFLRDASLKGFGLRILPSGTRTFIFEKRVEGRVRRMTLGKFGELTCEQARKQATKLAGQLAMGGNPIADRERERMLALTLEQAFADFVRLRPLKERTLYDYRRLLEVAFADFKARPLVALSKGAALKLHQELGTIRGEAYANLAMRFLRSLFNFAIAHYEDGFGRPLLAENPVARITQTRAWFHTERRQTVIKVWELAPWYRAVDALRQTPQFESATIADYLEFLLYTGLRRQEAAQLTWARVDLRDRSLTIPDPKNRAPHVLPLPDRAVALLEQRQANARNGYVFAGTGRHGYLVEPKRQLEKVVAASGVEFTLHDLRRTFITVAESLDIPPYAIKRLVNHKMKNDVTAGYIVSDLERLRAPMQKVADFLGRATGRVEGPPVVQFPKVAA
jgi:integrase